MLKKYPINKKDNLFYLKKLDIENETENLLSDMQVILIYKSNSQIVTDADTGEYKIVFKAYYEDTLIQTVRSTFIVVP